MRLSLLSISVIFAFSVFTSCEVPIEIEGDSQLVVQSLFTDNQDLIVYVTESNLRSSSDEKIVDNATVTLFTGDSLSFLTSLIFVNDPIRPFYQTVDFSPVEGVLYMLRVEVPGFKPVTASTIIPIAVNFNSDAPEISETNGESGLINIQFEVSVSINDPFEHDNYYHILFSQELISQLPGADGQIINDTSILSSKDELFIACTSECGLIRQLLDYPSFILNDTEFNGRLIKFNFAGNYAYDPTIYRRGNLKLEMRTVSTDYYQNALNLLKTGNIDPFFDFDESYSNVNNGVGIFAGYTTRFKYFPN